MTADRPSALTLDQIKAWRKAWQPCVLVDCEGPPIPGNRDLDLDGNSTMGLSPAEIIDRLIHLAEIRRRLVLAAYDIFVDLMDGSCIQDYKWAEFTDALMDDCGADR